MKILKCVHHYLFEYNLFIAICGLFYFRFCAFSFNQTYPIEIYIFAFSSIVLIYNIFRAYTDLKHLRESFFSERGILIGISFCFACISYSQFTLSLQIGYGILGVLTCAYKFEIIQSLKLRTVPFLKLPIIVMVWVISGSLFGIIHSSEAQFNFQLFEFLGIQFLFFCSITIPFDVFGLVEDQFITIPSKIGSAKALLLSKIAIACCSLWGLFFYDPIALKVAHLIFTGLTFGIIHRSQSLQKKWLQYVLLDGSIILQTIILLLFEQLSNS